MEEIIKRLQILKLSIALKDFDSIELQIKRLEKLNVNQQVHNIIALIKNRQHYHAMLSINAYPNDLYSNEYYSKVRAEEEAVIDEFELFESGGGKMHEPVTSAKVPLIEKIEDETQILKELQEEEEKIAPTQPQESDDEPQEQGVIKNSWFVDEVATKEEETNQSPQTHEKVQESQEETQEEEIANTQTKEPTNTYDSWQEESKIASQIDTSNPLSYTKDYTFDEPLKPLESNTYDHNLIMEDDLDDIAKDYYRQKFEEDIDHVKYGKVQESSPSEVPTPEEPSGMDDEGFYQPIQFLDQKFDATLKRYPQKEPIESNIDSIKHIVTLFEQPYGENEIDIALKQFDEFKRNEEYEEAAKILLLLANTQSQTAHFRLARELFKGDVLVQNYPEAFIAMNDLALEGYVEAICDLGQFYEYGIGIKKDRKKALSLYEEAHQLGLERAKELYDKLQNAKKNFFSYLFD
ncbi:MAG: hypothetical protein KU38_02410 [Sulfurovum sp. FS08-3]|nr:MAG: hypothetical protein KU38_02410 [Sulfurovum sp. FS08-3]